MNRVRTAAFAAFAAAGLLSANVSIAGDAPQKPKMLGPCKQCHQPADNVLRGEIENISEAAGMIQLTTGAIWAVRFDDKTAVSGWKKEEIGDLPKGRQIAVTYVETNGTLLAESVSIKKPAKLPEEKIMKVEELANLVALGPGKGNFFLVDSRPAPKFNEGFIPGAIGIYDAEFEKNLEKLPKEKDKLLIFYCAGPT